MSTEPINYEAVIADLEAKRAHLDSMIAGLRAVAGMGSLGTSPSGGSGGDAVGTLQIVVLNFLHQFRDE